jgi:hypothetical protein
MPCIIRWQLPLIFRDSPGMYNSLDSCWNIITMPHFPSPRGLQEAADSSSSHAILELPIDRSKEAASLINRIHTSKLPPLLAIVAPKVQLPNPSLHGQVGSSHCSNTPCTTICCCCPHDNNENGEAGCRTPMTWIWTCRPFLVACISDGMRRIHYLLVLGWYCWRRRVYRRRLSWQLP